MRRIEMDNFSDVNSAWITMRPQSGKVAKPYKRSPLRLYPHNQAGPSYFWGGGDGVCAEFSLWSS